MIRSRESSLKSTLEKMDFGEKPEFNMFVDYLGLHNLICPSEPTISPIPSPCSSVCDFSMETSSSSSIHRHRMNSLDSDGLSDSSSSGESREAELIDTELFVYPPPTSSPPMQAILETPSYPPPASLGSLIAQKAALNRLQPIATSNTNNSHSNRSSKNSNKATVCVFCRNNGESKEFYSSHTLKDNEGNTSCPILRAYTCPLCKANGDNSHTVKYCPKYTPKIKVDKLLHVGLHQL